MPLSSVVGAQSIIKPGVCTSSTRPAVPFEGQMIYETDTDKVLVWNGTAWYPNWNLPWGVQIKDDETATSSSFVTAVTVGTGTMTAIANRLYRMTYFEPQLSTSALGSAQMKILDGATQLQMSYIYVPASVQETNGIITVTTTLSAGSHTINATLIRASPITLTATRSATQPAIFTVEDIGPA